MRQKTRSIRATAWWRLTCFRRSESAGRRSVSGKTRTAASLRFFDYEHGEMYSDAAVIYSGDIADVIREANRLERRATGKESFGTVIATYMIVMKPRI